MNYLRQFTIIVGVSFLGEALKQVLPFPVPGSIYGMILLFCALCLGIIKLEHVREVSLFLIEIMPVLFVSAGVRLMESWHLLQPIILPVVCVIVISTIVVMVSAGTVVQWMLRRSKTQKGTDIHV